MNKINWAALAGIVFFSAMLCAFIGVNIHQTTVALLAGVLIGLAVTIPTVTIIMYLGLRNSGHVPPANQSQGVPQSMTWNTYHTHNHLHVVHVPEGASKSERRIAVAEQLRVGTDEAQRMIEAGAVKLIGDHFMRNPPR